MEKSEDTSEQAASGPGEKVKYLFYISCIYDDESQKVSLNWNRIFLYDLNLTGWEQYSPLARQSR